MNQAQSMIMFRAAARAARAAGKILKSRASLKKRVTYKGRVNLVTEVDTLSEATIIDYLAARFPNHSFLAEEGGGARLNGEKIRVSATASVSRSLLATGFPYDVRESKNNNLDHFSNFAVRAQAVRRGGSAALDLCQVACGRLDGFWELKLGPWDTAAGAFIVKEAGGKLTDFSGNDFDIFRKEIAASNGKIHKEMLRTLELSLDDARRTRKRLLPSDGRRNGVRR